jgi:hypothetical protein
MQLTAQSLSSSRTSPNLLTLQGWLETFTQLSYPITVVFGRSLVREDVMSRDGL